MPGARWPENHNIWISQVPWLPLHPMWTLLSQWTHPAPLTLLKVPRGRNPFPSPSASQRPCCASSKRGYSSIYVHLGFKKEYKRRGIVNRTGGFFNVSRTTLHLYFEYVFRQTDRSREVCVCLSTSPQLKKRLLSAPARGICQRQPMRSPRFYKMQSVQKESSLFITELWPVGVVIRPEIRWMSTM